jgi:hypothetical protein
VFKITIVERIFQIGRPKLMMLGAFAWTYNFVTEWLTWVEALPPWQAVKRFSFRIQRATSPKVRKLARAGSPTI